LCDGSSSVPFSRVPPWVPFYILSIGDCESPRNPPNVLEINLSFLRLCLCGVEESAIIGGDVETHIQTVFEGSTEIFRAGFPSLDHAILPGMYHAGFLMLPCPPIHQLDIDRLSLRHVGNIDLAHFVRRLSF
jgi:hypothetical protein